MSTKTYTMPAISLKPGEGFYFGSRIFQTVGDSVGLSVDQLNHVICQLVALAFSIPFRTILHPGKVSPVFRHVVEVVLGTALVYFCFGSQLFHLVAQAIFCYGAMVFVPKYSHIICFILSLGYLAMLHIYRQIYDYGGYTLDITGPLMISTQKLSDLAFSVHDGVIKDETTLSPAQKTYAQRQTPRLLELLSYILSFHNVMLGPFVLYKDYIDFISGENIKINNPKYSADEFYEPRPSKVMLKKAIVCLVNLVLMLWLLPKAPASHLQEESYLNSGFLYKICYMLLSLTLMRTKYYFAWTLGELVNVGAGLGFTGYKQDGSEDWDMINNADIWNVEFSLSMKTNIDSWNIRTLLWLRRVVYERAPFANTLAVFTVSAFWHGFYPGYYIAFFTAAIFVFANRSIRRFIRPWFQRSKMSALCYDVITFTFSRFCNVYMCSAFVLYALEPIYYFYRSQYFWLHVLGVLAIVGIPRRPPSKEKTT